MFRISLIFLVSLAFFACSGPNVVDNLPSVVQTINEKCPKMIDSETRIDAVELRAVDTLVYYFTLVNFQRDKIDTAQFNRAMWPGIISNIKISPEMKSLRQAEVKFIYSYQDKEAKPICQFRILPVHYR